MLKSGLLCCTLYELRVCSSDILLRSYNSFVARLLPVHRSFGSPFTTSVTIHIYFSETVLCSRHIFPLKWCVYFYVVIYKI